MVSSTLCPAVHILGSQNVYGRAEGIADHYWPWAVFLGSGPVRDDDMPEKSGSYPGTCFWLLINIQKRPIEFFVPYSSQSDLFVQDKKFQIFPQ